MADKIPAVCRTRARGSRRAKRGRERERHARALSWPSDWKHRPCICSRVPAGVWDEVCGPLHHLQSIIDLPIEHKLGVGPIHGRSLSHCPSPVTGSGGEIIFATPK